MAGSQYDLPQFKGARHKIPVGTEVKDILIVGFSSDSNMGPDDDDLGSKIQFVVVTTGKTFAIRCMPSYHPGKTIEDYLHNMFTAKPIDDLTREFEPYETNAVKEGVITQGIRKAAVLASYGPP